MAQSIILKRSSLQGKVPTTSSLNVGEIAINTYDGKIYLNRSGSSQSIQEIVTTNVINTGSITLTKTGSFGELVVSQDGNFLRDLYVTRDIIGNGSIDILGAVSASIVSASLFIGNGAGLVNITASMRPDDFDFNSQPFAGTTGYIQGSGSLYKVATTNTAVEFRYNDILRGKFDITNGFSGSIFGIGDVVAFSSSVANLNAFTSSTAGLNSLNSFTASAGIRLTNLETTSASVNSSITNINSFTASENSKFVTLGNLTGSLATTGSNSFKADQQITGSLGVSGDITVLGSVNARQFNIGIISSSILYTSGSTKFGDTIDDTMSVTGSLRVSGSTVFTGSVTAANGFTGSLFGTASYALNGSSNAIMYQTASAASVWTFNHFLATPYPVVTVYDNNNSVIIPQSIVSNDSSSLTITFSSARTGVAVASKGGYVGSAVGTATTANALSTGRLINNTLFDGTQNITIQNLVSGSTQISLAGTSDYSSLFGGIGASTSSLNIFTSSATLRLTNLETATGSNTVVSQSIFFINNYTGSAAISQSVVNNRLTALEIASSSLEFFTSSQNTKNSTLATYTSSIDTKFATLGIVSSSLNQFTASINGWSGSIATTGSNTFRANQIITGSLSVNGVISGSSDIVFSGAGSTTSSPRLIGITPYVAGNAAQFIFGDNGNAIQNAFGGLMQIVSYHGMEIYGGRVGTAVAFNTSVANTNPSLNVKGTETTRPTLVATAAGSQTANIQEWRNFGNTPLASISSAGLIVGSIGATNGVVSGSSQVSIAATSDYTSLFTGIASSTSSLNTFSASNANTSLNTYTGSISDPKFLSIGASTSSLNTFSASVSSSILNLNTYSASVSNSIQQLNLFTSSTAALGSLNAFTASSAIRLTNLESTTASLNISVTNLNSYSASVSNSILYVNTVTASLNTFTASASSRLTNLETTSASVNISVTNINTFTASNAIASLNTYTGSISDPKFVQIGASTSSLNGFTSSAALRLTNLETTSASVNGHIADINSKTGSYARTNSTNTFNGTQIISGALYITQDLVVLGSSSIQNISSSNLVIGTSYVTLNTFSPSSRFAGLNFIDSGSAGLSGSLYYDSVDDEIVFVHKGNGTNVTSSHVVMGPETYDNLGNEIYLATNRIPKITNYEHIGNSNISDTGTEISLNSLTSVTGSFIVTNGITGSIRATNGIVSGSSQISLAGTSDYTSLFGGIASATSSLNSFSASQNTKDSTLATYTGSIDTKFASIGASTSSLNTYTASTDTRFSALQASTASLNVYTQSNDTVNTTQNARLTALENSTGSNVSVSQSIYYINNYTGSAFLSQSVVNNRLTALEIASSSLEIFTSSQNTKNSTLAIYTGSNDTKWINLAIYTASIDTKFGAIQSTTNSLNLFTASNFTSQLNLFTSSAALRLTNLETTSASVNISVSSLNTYSASVSNSIQQLNLFTSSTAALGSLNSFTSSAAIRLSNLETTSASVNISVLNLNTYSASVSNSIQQLSSKTGSYATTGSNSFNGNQIITGSLTVTSLTTIATSLTTNSSSFVLTSGSNLIIQNAGLAEITGSLRVSGSTTITGSVNITGSLTATSFNGTINSTNGVVSGSSQILGGTGIISSSAQLSGTTITNLTVVNLTTVNETASVIFSSGSNTFGDAGNDIHSFTGSVQISGSLTITGSVSAANGFTGSLLGTASYALNGSSNAIMYQTASAASTWVFNHFLATSYPVVTVYDNNNSVIIPQSITANDSSSLTITFSSARTGVAVASKGGYVGSAVATATVANALTTARLINGTSFDGTQNITIPNLVSGSIQVLGSTGIVSSSTQIIPLLPSGTISGSSQLTSSYDIRYALSGSVGGASVPTGTVSGSTQISLAGTSDYGSLFGGIAASTSSLNVFTSSAALRLTNLETTSASLNISVSNINSYTASVSNSIQQLSSKTGSYATTGSNSFNGNQIITGSLQISGSLNIIGRTTLSGSLSLSPSQSAFLVSHSISQSATVGATVYGVNITPYFNNTTSSQTQTALRVMPTFTGSFSGSNTTNIIADFGATSVGSQFTINDVVSGSIYMVNDVSGLPIIEALSDGQVNMYDFPYKAFNKSGSYLSLGTSLTPSSSVTVQSDFIVNKGYGLYSRTTQASGSTVSNVTSSLFNLVFSNVSSSVFMSAVVTGYDTGSRQTITGDIKSTIKYNAGIASVVGYNQKFLNSEVANVNFDIAASSTSASLLVYGSGSKTYNWGATITYQVI
jgi:hypothetical protein